VHHRGAPGRPATDCAERLRWSIGPFVPWHHNPPTTPAGHCQLLPFLPGREDLSDPARVVAVWPPSPSTSWINWPGAAAAVRSEIRAHRLPLRTSTVTVPGSSWLSSLRSSRCGRCRRGAAGDGSQEVRPRRIPSPAPRRPITPLMAATGHPAASPSQESPLAG